MRKVILSLLLASAIAAPAAAQRGEWRGSKGQHDQAGSEQFQGQSKSEERVQRREERVQQVEERAQFRGKSDGAEASAEATARAERRDVEMVRAARMNRAPTETLRQSEQSAEPVGRQWRGDPGARVRTRRIEQVGDTDMSRSGLRQSDRPVPQVFRNRAPLVSDMPRAGTQPPPRLERRSSSVSRWSGDWRHHDRYDWRSWRTRNRSLFHLGFYSDPFGWGYQPYSVGWRMWPSYYRSSYWLNDPWQYRLPYAPPGMRWIRYYDDAVLVDTWDGRVVDVIYNFFW